MKNEKKVLGAQVSISDVDLIALPLKTTQKIVKKMLACEIANAIIENDLIEIKETPDFEHGRKIATAKVVLLTPEEYENLRKTYELFW